MGRDTMLYVFIGRECNVEEQLKIVDNIFDDYDHAHIFELDPKNPFMEIDGYPVVFICNNKGESWYICEKLIGSYDIEHQDKPIEFEDLSCFKSENNGHKLMLVAEISY